MISKVSVRLRGAVTFLSIGLAWCAVAGASIVITSEATFEDVTAPGNPSVNELYSAALLFTSDTFNTVSDPDAGLLDQVDNGTIYVAEIGEDEGLPITMRRADGAPFALVSFDGAECFLNEALAQHYGFGNAAAIEVTAVTVLGETVSASFPLDGIKDGPDGADDFEGFTLPVEFGNVTSATFGGTRPVGGRGAIAVDNIVTEVPIPEPASIVLTGIAVMTLAMVRRKTRRHLT